MPNLTLDVVAGVVYATISSGVVTAAALRVYRAQVMGALARPPDVFVADFRAPLWAVKDTDLGAFFDLADDRITAPAALIVTPATADLFRRHCWACAYAGIMRKVFFCPSSALEWALVRQAVARQDRRARTVRR